VPGSDTEWVVLHCYATYEDLVLGRIVKRVPQAEVKRLPFPGFLAWRWDPAVWHEVRNAGGVTGYVGSPGEPALHRMSDLD
jgi:transcription antitermination factor NusG